MLLEKVLKQAPDSAALLLRREIYAEGGPTALVRDVLAVANAAAGEIRHVLFGADLIGGRVQICGLDEGALARFRELSQDVAELIEPGLRINQVFAEAGGKTIAALEISGCNNPPYTLRHRIDEDMRTGACWVRDDNDVRPARRDDMDRIYARRDNGAPAPVLVGLNGDATCLQLAIDVPDTTRPPSYCAREKLMSAIDAKKTAEQMLGNDNTGMSRLAHARIFGLEAPYLPRGVDTLVEHYDSADDEYADADQHYFYEQQAVRLELAARNLQPQILDEAVIELSLPRVPGFDVADRLYSDPEGRQTALQSSLIGYPEVEKFADHVSVRAEVGRLDPGSTQSVFETPLRIRVGPEMRGMKVAIKYSLITPGLKNPVNGRLKMVFRR